MHVELLDADGKATSVLTTHEAATIHVEMTAHTPLQDTVVGVRIDSLAGGVVWETSTRRNGRTIGMIDGPASVDVAIGSLPAARRRVRPDGGVDRSHRGPPVRPLGTSSPVRGSAVQVVRHRPREHPRRMDDHRRTRRPAERVVRPRASRMKVLDIAAARAGAARTAGARRRTGLLRRDLQRGGVGSGRRSRTERVRAGQPLAVAPWHGARAPLPDPSRAGQARALCPGFGRRRRGRPSARVSDVRRSGRRSNSTTSTGTSSGSRSGSRTGSASRARSPTSCTRRRTTTTPPPRAGSVSTIPRSAWSGPTSSCSTPNATGRRRLLSDDRGRPAVHLPALT